MVACKSHRSPWMSLTSRWRRWAGPAGLAGLALLGAGLVLARQMEFGAGLNYDSADYIHVARQMQAGAAWHWRSHRGEGRFVQQPPLYPAVLAAATGGVLDPLDVAGPLNAALFGGVVLLCGASLRRRLAARPLWGWCGCAAIALSPPLVLWASTAMTDTLFAVFTMGALILVAEKDPPTGRLALATALTALACLTRHAGGTLVVVVSAVLLLASDLHWAKRLQRAAAYAILASAPSGLWLLLVRPPIEHYETAAGLPVLASLGDYMATWVFLELPTTTWFGTGWGALLASVALFSIGVAALRKRLIWRPLVVFTGYVVANLVFLLIAAELGSFVAVQKRYLVPSYVPCLFVAWLVVGNCLGAKRQPQWAGPMPRRPRRVALVVLLTLMVAPWLAYQAVMHKSAIVERNLRGFDYDRSRWRDSETLRYLRQHLAHHARNSRVYVESGYTPAVYFHTGIAPFIYYCAANPRDGDYLLWLQATPDPCAGQDGTYSSHAMPGLDPVADFADGVLLRFNAASTGTLADGLGAFGAERPAGE